MTRNEKLDLLNYLIFIRGKLQSLAIELLLEGQDSSRVETAERKLTSQVDKLRSGLMQQWQGDADSIVTELRDLNEKAQSKIREMRNATNKTEKVREVVGILDKGLQLVTNILA